MNAKKKVGLGRGLDALLGATTVLEAQTNEDQAIRQIAIDLLRPGKYQPRRQMSPDALAELAESILSQGIIQPIAIRPVSLEGHYEILAGERRWRAARLAGLSFVPVIVHDISDDQALLIALIENIQREDLTALEEAQGICRLIDEFGLTHQEVAEKLGRSRSAITNLLRLLSLPEPVQEYLLEGEIEMGHARALLSLPIEEQLKFAREIIQNGLSVRRIEEMVRQYDVSSHAQIAPTPKETVSKVNPDAERLQNRLSDWFGAKTQVTANQKGKGKITISFSDLDQLDALLGKLGVPDED